MGDDNSWHDDDADSRQSAEVGPARVKLLVVGEASGGRELFLEGIECIVQTPLAECGSDMLISLQGHFGAGNLGQIAAAAFNTRSNDASAVWLLRHAARSTCDSLACFNWGCVLAEGCNAAGVPRDLSGALVFLRRAHHLRALAHTFYAEAMRELFSLARLALAPLRTR